MTLVCSRQSWNLAGDPALNAPCGEVFWKTTSRSGSGTAPA